DIREQIESLTLELHQLLGGRPHVRVDGVEQQRKRILSPTGRAKIAAAQRLRWAKFNAARGGRPQRASRHLLSPEGRARVSAAVKARWARFRATKAKSSLARQ
ncbi:MAG: hypothetical protein JWR69_2392, partial [Pedosphaera sp.]|nr:hypothetical protein [Pedosphaera sp.]